MSKVKLDLSNKNDIEIREFATNHQTAMIANANYLTPAPAPIVFDGALVNYVSKLDAVATAETALKTLRAEKSAARLELENNLTLRGSYVETTSAGDEAKILSAAFGVQAAGAATTSMPAPQNMMATTGDNAGEVDLACNSVAKAKSYICEYREHSETAAPGPWVMGKVFSRSSGTLTGLVSGRKYAFRVRALGPNDIESPWSDEAVSMAA